MELRKRDYDAEKHENNTAETSLHKFSINSSAWVGLLLRGDEVEVQARRERLHWLKLSSQTVEGER